MTWKAVERRVAKFFGGVRNTLSGEQGGGDVAIVTRWDDEGRPIEQTPHPTYFVDSKHCKERLNPSVWTLMKETREKARREKKIPILVLHRLHQKQYILCIDLRDIEKVVQTQEGETTHECQAEG